MSEQQIRSPQSSDNISLDKQEWCDSVEYLLREYGSDGVREVYRAIQAHAKNLGVSISDATINSPYVNSIPVDAQPPYPGDVVLEKRIENIIRWNAMAMVLQAVDSGSGVGGHIATYSSTATMLEVGFNHFFRKRDEGYGGDMVMMQPHAAPGIYARAYLEGRLTDVQLKNFRRQLQPGGGLSSYPHPRLMPDFWEMANASMGLSTPAAIYQARFAKYLENRGLKPKSGGKVWCFIGDGEADEPEVLGTINIAARENLDNLILIVNCNLQRLDGPVRGNGKIIQELERSFLGADWNVLKVIWGSGWDGLLAQDSDGILRQRMESAVDGDYQYFSVLPGNIQREHWVEENPDLARMMNALSDDEIQHIKRGGQDPKKVFAAFDRATRSSGKPTVILVKTVKGDGMGPTSQGRNTAHQKKNLTAEERIERAREYGIPLNDSAAAAAKLYRPDDDSAEICYLKEHRDRLGGFLPDRIVDCQSLQTPPISFFQELLNGTGERANSSTTALIRIIARLLKHKDIGRYIVPIVPDEARTFGMDSLFRAAGIYSAEGQNYIPVDADSLAPYNEAIDGQILQEGICETGAIASFLAAGTAYAVHGVPTIPFYIFYSIFGFQRVGDMIWSCGDMMCRGFLIGGTAGRTTLNGEGLQHQDGHSHILGSTVPNVKSYDPAFSYELAIIVRDGIFRMYEKQEAIFYYLTVYNENYPMPPISIVGEGVDSVEAGVLRGAYCFRRASDENSDNGKVVNLLGSGAIMQQVLAAADQLETLGFLTNIWSVTSYVELYRDAIAVERWNRLHPTSERRQSYVSQLFSEESGVFVAVTDYMKSLANSIAPWMPRSYTALGTDGYGLSEAREDLRDYFEVSPAYIVQAALYELYRHEQITDRILSKLSATVEISPEKLDPAVA
tara:strand:+ start:13540 stop:16248 length:2709 start_codon:yes stop_codon:yes gene_type:complete